MTPTKEDLLSDERSWWPEDERNGDMEMGDGRATGAGQASKPWVVGCWLLAALQFQLRGHKIVTKTKQKFRTMACFGGKV
jgi:hypothetical protein